MSGFGNVQSEKEREREKEKKEVTGKMLHVINVNSRVSFIPLNEWESIANDTLITIKFGTGKEIPNHWGI